MSEEFNSDDATEAAKRGGEEIAASEEAIKVNESVANEIRSAADESIEIQRQIAEQGAEEIAKADAEALVDIIEGAEGGNITESETKSAVDELNQDIFDAPSPIDALLKGEESKTGKNGEVLTKMANVFRGWLLNSVQTLTFLNTESSITT